MRGQVAILLVLATFVDTACDPFMAQLAGRKLTHPNVASFVRTMEKLESYEGHVSKLTGQIHVYTCK